MTTFKEQQKSLTNAQHSLAVWEAVYKFLDENFIAHDDPHPRKAIKANDCLVDVVTEDTIEDILQSIAKERIAPLQKIIDGIMGQEVVVLDKEDN